MERLTMILNTKLKAKQKLNLYRHLPKACRACVAALMSLSGLAITMNIWKPTTKNLGIN